MTPIEVLLNGREVVNGVIEVGKPKSFGIIDYPGEIVTIDRIDEGDDESYKVFQGEASEPTQKLILSENQNEAGFMIDDNNIRAKFVGNK